MLVDLASTTTSDGVKLDGPFFAPKPGMVRKGPVEAALGCLASLAPAAVGV